MNNKNYDYKFEDIVRSLLACNIKSGDNVYVSGNLLNFGFCKTNNFNEIPELFFNAITKIIKKQVTIIVPTHTFYLANTNKIFNLKKTESVSGSFSNYILKKKKSIRQIHPFSSSAAIGKNAKYFCSKNTDNVYGIDSPFDRMIKKKNNF